MATNTLKIPEDIVLGDILHRERRDEMRLMTHERPRTKKRKLEMDTATAPHIPEDIVLGNILHRFPVKSLLRFSSVSKLWYKSIHHDPRFLFNHSLESQKNPRLIFRFDIPIPTLSPILPDIILIHILSRLPIESLSRFRCVSKLWLKLFQDLIFVDYIHGQSQSIITNPNIIYILIYTFSTYTSHFFYLENDASSSVDGDLRKIATSSYYYGIDQKEKIGNCNGLVCFMVQQQERILIEICNPSRREILTISSQSLLHPDAFSLINRFGFGFDSVKEEYKVVWIARDLYSINCLVFTLGTDSWREINIPSPQVSNLLGIILPFSIFCDGALFWRIRSQPKLVMFDLHDEKFQVIQFPEGFDSSTSCYRQLELNGSLCVAHWPEDEDSVGSKKNYKEVHLYILKDKNEPVWIKESFLLPFVTSQCDLIMDYSGQVVMYWYNGEQVRFYNLHTKDRRVIQSPSGLGHHMHCGVTRQVENFLSLKTFEREGAHGTFCHADFYPC